MALLIYSILFMATVTRPLSCIYSTSEMMARLFRQHSITVAHKPTHKLVTTLTKHKDRISTTDRRNAIYTLEKRQLK